MPLPDFLNKYQRCFSRRYRPLSYDNRPTCPASLPPYSSGLRQRSRWLSLPAFPQGYLPWFVKSSLPAHSLFLSKKDYPPPMLLEETPRTYLFAHVFSCAGSLHLHQRDGHYRLFPPQYPTHHYQFAVRTYLLLPREGKKVNSRVCIYI